MLSVLSRVPGHMPASSSVAQPCGQTFCPKALMYGTVGAWLLSWLLGAVGLMLNGSAEYLGLP